MRSTIYSKEHIHLYPIKLYKYIQLDILKSMYKNKRNIEYSIQKTPYYSIISNNYWLFKIHNDRLYIDSNKLKNNLELDNIFQKNLEQDNLEIVEKIYQKQKLIDSKLNIITLESKSFKKNIDKKIYNLLKEPGITFYMNDDPYSPVIVSFMNNKIGLIMPIRIIEP